jgi:beta-N-acetylhexosaminidase
LIQELLRNTTGYNGVVFTDCLEMNAVRNYFSTEEIVLKSMNAGIDVMIASHFLEFQKELMDLLLFYVKKDIIPEKRIDESVSRILSLKNKYKFPENPEPSNNRVLLRKNIAVERNIADQSITLMKNISGSIPIDVNKNKSIIVIELAEPVSGPSVRENEGQSMVERVSHEFMRNRDFIMHKPSQPLPDELIALLDKTTYDYVIVCMYSRSGEKDTIQCESIRKLLLSRNDIIIASLESPYEIKKFPDANTFITSYGFRKVQLEALFKSITGKIQPVGRLPVSLSEPF